MEDVTKPLGEIDLNKDVSADEQTKDLKDEKDQVTCAYCKKSNPSKRCAKRHTRCMKLMFCDKVCELGSHQASKATKAEENKKDVQKTMANDDEAAKKLAAKKKAKKAARKNRPGVSDSGEFWWN